MCDVSWILLKLHNPLFIKVKGFVQLARPSNMLLCGFAVACGGFIAGKPFGLARDLFSGLMFSYMPQWAIRTLTASVSASLILAAGNVLNDVCDLDCDLINTPDRPLPSKRVTSKAATVFAVILAIAGIALSFLLGLPGVIVALAASVLLFVYDIKLKRLPLAGNIVVAFLGGLAFIYGGIAGNAVYRSILPAVFAANFHLGRELVKDAVDIEGDLSAGIKTAASIWGVDTTCRIAAVILTALTVIVAVPFFTGYFGPVYFTIIAIGVWPPLVYSVIVLLKKTSVKRLRFVSFVLKADIPVGILALLIGFQGL